MSTSPGWSAHLDGGLRDRSEHATRNAGEQLDAMQRGDALDEIERVHRRRRDSVMAVERNPLAADPGYRALPRRRAPHGGPASGVAIDRYLPEDVRDRSSRTGSGSLVEEISTLEAVSDDETLASAPERHPALFADHGIVHARDVAAGVLELAASVDGRLLPARPGTAVSSWWGSQSCTPTSTTVG